MVIVKTVTMLIDKLLDAVSCGDEESVTVMVAVTRPTAVGVPAI